MLVWPALAVLGFVALNAIVIALGSTSTARYELERGGGSQSGPSAPSSPGPRPADLPAGGPAGQYRSWLRGGATARARRHRGTVAAGPSPADATHAAPRPPRAPAGRPATGRTLLRTRPRPARPADELATDNTPVVGWWLIADDEEGGDEVAAFVVAGPFDDEMEATWAALSSGLPDSANPRAVYARRRGDGALVKRQTPEERAWLAELGRQLDRLSEDWDELVSDTDELTSLVVEVTAALVEAGLPLYGEGGTAGGVCLTPDPCGDGVLVTWRQHDRMSVQQVRGAAADAAVQQTMSAALADVLAALGFGVEEFGGPGCHLVTIPS